MTKIKRRFLQFSFYDRTGIEKYLEKQALKGWRLCKIKGPLWCFEKTAPAQVHYSVAYLPAASAYDPEPTEAQKQFADFCAHTGWQQAACSGEMQVFYHEGEEPVPIETDALLEMENIHRAMKKNYLPSMCLLFFVGVMQMAMFISDWTKSHIRVLTETAAQFRGVMALILLIMTSVEIGGYFIWRHRAMKAAETDGSFIKTRGHQRLQWLMLSFAVVLLIYTLSTFQRSAAGLAVFSILYVLLIFMLVQGVTAFLKKRKVSGETNKTLTIMAAVVLSVVMIGILPFLGLSGFFQDRKPENVAVEAPLLPSDYFDVEPTEYDIDLNEAHSPLLKRSTYYISPMPIGRESPGVVYVIYDTQFDWAYDICLHQLLTDRQERSDQTDRAYMESYRPIDAMDFAAEVVYRQYWGEQPIVNGAYIVCYEDRIVLLRAGTELTGEQMRRIADKIKP